MRVRDSLECIDSERVPIQDDGMISSEDFTKLVLCLEPEAACMACGDHRLSEHGAAGREILYVNDRFMVLNCGAGPSTSPCTRSTK